MEHIIKETIKSIIICGYRRIPLILFIILTIKNQIKFTLCCILYQINNGLCNCICNKLMLFVHFLGRVTVLPDYKSTFPKYSTQVINLQSLIRIMCSLIVNGSSLNFQDLEIVIPTLDQAGLNLLTVSFFALQVL